MIRCPRVLSAPPGPGGEWGSMMFGGWGSTACWCRGRALGSGLLVDLQPVAAAIHDDDVAVRVDLDGGRAVQPLLGCTVRHDLAALDQILVGRQELGAP